MTGASRSGSSQSGYVDAAGDQRNGPFEGSYASVASTGLCDQRVGPFEGSYASVARTSLLTGSSAAVPRNGPFQDGTLAAVRIGPAKGKKSKRPSPYSEVSDLENNPVAHRALSAPAGAPPGGPRAAASRNGPFQDQAGLLSRDVPSQGNTGIVVKNRLVSEVSGNEPVAHHAPSFSAGAPPGGLRAASSRGGPSEDHAGLVPRAGPSQGNTGVVRVVTARDPRLAPTSESCPNQGGSGIVPASQPQHSALPKKRKTEETPLSPDPEPNSIGSPLTKPPPLFINEVTNIIDLARRLRLGVRLSAGTVLSLSGRNTLRVGCATEAEHVAVTAFLRQNGLQYHTFSNQKSSQARLVIRGLDLYSDPAEVAEELRELGYPISEAIRLHTLRGPRKPLALIRVTLPKGGDADRLLDVTSLCGLRIKVERSREAGHIPQCHRCQRFGHGSDMCGNAVACVRCGRPHLTPNCNLAPGADRYCINCGCRHAANYRGCVVFKHQRQLVAERAQKRAPAPAPRQQQVREMPGHYGGAFPPLPRVSRPAQQQPQTISTPPIITDPLTVPLPMEEEVVSPREASPLPPARWQPVKSKKGRKSRKTSTATPKPQPTSQQRQQQPRQPQPQPRQTQPRQPKPTPPTTSPKPSTTASVRQAPPQTEPQPQTKPKTTRTTSQQPSLKAPVAAAPATPTSSTSQPAKRSALAEISSFLEEFDLEEVARIYRQIRDRLHKADARQRFLLLAEAAAAIGMLEL